MPRSHPTIRDVAHLAGVSHQTVSRVINGSTEVTPETRERVEAAIMELGYSPNAIARSMARGRTHTLACIAPNLTDYTFASIIEGAEAEARQLGYFLLSSSAYDAESFRDQIDDLVAHRRVDGVMVINPYADDRSRFIPPNFPVAYVGGEARGEQVDTVCLDDEKAGFDATRHLLELGFSHIVTITGPLEEDCAQDRRTGYLKAMKQADIAVEDRQIYAGDWSASSGYEALMHFHKSGMLPQAVFAQNDRMALGVLHAARELGLRIPTQLAVIGVDDMPLASYFDPPLTTMRQDITLIGRETVRLLIRSIDEPGSFRQHLRIPAELVIRSSTVNQSGKEV